MPLYEYKCLECDELLEIIQKFSDPPLTKCTSCGGELKRLLSSPAIQFKGDGWYVTDYSSKSKPSEAKKESDSGKEADKGSKDKESSSGKSQPESKKETSGKNGASVSS